MSDTGIGIPQEILPKLFKLYGTFDHSKGNNRHGVGLGLVICEKLAEILGTGDIRLKSKINEGTTVSFSIFADISAVGEEHIMFKRNSQVDYRKERVSSV